jgi:hypothetical protein
MERNDMRAVTAAFVAIWWLIIGLSAAHAEAIMAVNEILPGWLSHNVMLISGSSQLSKSNRSRVPGSLLLSVRKRSRYSKPKANPIGRLLRNLGLPLARSIVM